MTCCEPGLVRVRRTDRSLCQRSFRVATFSSLGSFWPLIQGSCVSCRRSLGLYKSDRRRSTLNGPAMLFHLANELLSSGFAMCGN